MCASSSSDNNRSSSVNFPDGIIGPVSSLNQIIVEPSMSTPQSLYEMYALCQDHYSHQPDVKGGTLPTAYGEDSLQHDELGATYSNLKFVYKSNCTHAHKRKDIQYY